MAGSKLKQEIKRHAIIVAIVAYYSDLQIAQFIKVTQFLF